MLVIFAGAIAYFALTQLLGVVQGVGRGIEAAVGTIDANYIAADQFITGLVEAFLAIAIFGVAIWVYNYSQAKSLMAGG